MRRALHRLLLPLALAGCSGPEHERSTELAHVDVEMMRILIGSNAIEGDLRLRRAASEPCIALGDDYHARIDTVDLNVDPGGYDELNCAPDVEDCGCLPPYFNLSWPPKLAVARLEVADDSRTIACDLGDAFAERTITRVDATTWTATRGDQVSVRIAPATEVSRFALALSFPPLSVPHTVSGDVLTFTLPASLAAGPQELRVSLSGQATASCNVPATTTYEYFIHQDIDVL